jgi:hypothetical protein
LQAVKFLLRLGKQKINLILFMKKLVFSILFVLQAVFVWSQHSPALKGKVVDSKTQKPLRNVVATITSTNQSALTDATGVFSFDVATEGQQTLTVGSTGYTTQTYTLSIVKGQSLDLGVVFLEEDITSEQQLSLITITENDLGDDNSGSESTAGLLQASRDTYQQAAAFNWGQARFRIRGLDNEYGTTMINGIVMNKLFDGRPQWSNWGGLNDATRNQEFTMGSAPSDYTFGNILGTQEINTRASFYRPGTRVSFSGTNSNYSWRTMATYASGMNKDGWAFVVSGSRRWAKEGYFEGTDYSANSLFASIEKKFNDKHSINFTSIYAQNSRGKNSPNTQEVTDLMGTEYNSYWGWQNGKKRNSRDKNVDEPILMLSHYWKINERNTLNTNISYQSGGIGNSRLDYNGGNNPDPTYYKNLPSYYLNLHNIPADGSLPTHTPNYAQAEIARVDFINNSQINWERMYHANDINKRSIYALYEDRMEDVTWTANSILNSQLSDNITLNAGINFRSLKSENFQKMLDPLGDYGFMDTDLFYEGNGFTAGQSQSDLNNPNRVVNAGDRYGYNYIMRAIVADAFTQFKFTYNKFDFYLAQTFSQTRYQREGLYRNGLYADNSYGKSDKLEFNNYGFKGGLTYKITGKHMLSVNAAYMTKAPMLRNAFNNARLNNSIVSGLDDEKISSVDASYIIRAPKLKARLTGFYSKIEDATKVGFFYAEGLGAIEDGGNDSENDFVAEITKNIDKQNIGLELGLEYQLSKTIKVTGSASYGQYIYSNNPTVLLNIDSRQAAGLNPIVNFGDSYLKNYRQGGMPQQAYSLGIEYRDPKFWWIGANANYLDDSYVEVDPLIRTNNFFMQPGGSGVSYPEVTEDRARQLLSQEKFDSFMLVNLTGGKSWRIHGNTLGFFASVNNIFDVTYKTGGFEQARNANYRELNMDYASGTRSFGSKYFYGYGRTYFVNVYLTF